MKELLRSNDPVRLSWAEALLAAAGIEILVADRHTSVVEGSAGAIQRRILVAEKNFRRAQQILADADPVRHPSPPPSAEKETDGA